MTFSFVRVSLFFMLITALGIRAWADGVSDNDPTTVRRLPKAGIEITADQRATLESQLQKLHSTIEELHGKQQPSIDELLPDVEVYYKAVHDALAYQEFFDPREVDEALPILAEGQKRGEQLLVGNPYWQSATGLVIRGYRSRIDGSVQPYGLVVPSSYTTQGASRHRLDIWFHGRGETLSELNFIRDRQRNPGTFTPPDTIVLHPYGRYNNAFKFAGEVDVLEALASVEQRYRVDEDRVAVRGFSMGGAGCWQFAVHYADQWCAANPGAGFAETPEFLKSFQQQTLQPTWFEQRLWHMYDCTDWAANLHQCPTVAYSGALDTQKQAADIMQAALAREHMNLVHVIGPETKHAYHPAARAEVDERMTELARIGRQRIPSNIKFVTYTLKYNRTHWLIVDGITEHWEEARVEARLNAADSTITIDAKNVTDLTVQFEPATCPFDIAVPIRVNIDGAVLDGPTPLTDHSLTFSLHQTSEGWRGGVRDANQLRKRHNLQGPIDDAFMDSFIFVRPTGKSRHELVNKWCSAEMERAIEHWRRHFRGEARVKQDQEITEYDLARTNLVLWGDFESNSILSRIAPQLPVTWNAETVKVGDQVFSPDVHALIAIYPNPLHPDHYVVLNSGFTFRDFAHLNNARQVPMLPDWAIVDLRTPPGNVWPGKIVSAGFFDEQWRVK